MKENIINKLITVYLENVVGHSLRNNKVLVRCPKKILEQITKEFEQTCNITKFGDIKLEPKDIIITNGIQFDFIIDERYKDIRIYQYIDKIEIMDKYEYEILQFE